MIKIKILELDKHRNETTFRPYLMAARELFDIGIQFVSDGSYDFAWVGQASIADKKLELNESVDLGVEFCNQITGDYMIFDGQDSHSLIGTIDVFQWLDERCVLFLKNTLLRSPGMYKEPTVNGRWYWGPGDYSVPGIDALWDAIALSGTNWLHTAPVKFYDYGEKLYDVSALFGYPLDSGTEHGLDHYYYYNSHRKRCVDALTGLNDLRITMLSGGVRLTPHEYYNNMYHSKIIVAPFGFGEIAPRDLEAAAFGSILIKPDMSHIRTEPNPYIAGETYLPCKHDYSDLEFVIRAALADYDHLRDHLVGNMRKKFLELYTPQRIALYLHDLFMRKVKTIDHD